MKLHVLYRISDGGYKKDKLEFADKFYCLDNFIKVFGTENLIVFADNCKPETLERLKHYPIVLQETNKGSSAQSWRMVAEYSIAYFKPEDAVYFVEDDYLHRPNSKTAILEGLAIADYVTLYDHPDKYIDKEKGGNPLVKGGGEKSTVWLTDHSHWKQTSSTTMTVACKVKTLKEDWSIWDQYTQGTLPSDDLIFYKLQSLKKLKFKIFGKKRRLISSIPAFSTHIEKKWLSPLIDWSLV